MLVGLYSNINTFLFTFLTASENTAGPITERAIKTAINRAGYKEQLTKT